MGRNTIIGGLLCAFSVLLLDGCIISEKKLVERNTLKYAVIDHPEFQACQTAVDGAYRRITTLQLASYQPTYVEWGKLNDLMGNMLSAMTSGDYVHCVTRADQLDTYIRVKQFQA